jgi:hypothetical protein
LDWGFFVLEKSGLIFCKIPEVFLLLGRKAILLILVVGRGVYIQSITPVEPLVQKLVHNVYLDWKLPTILATFLMVSEAIQVCRFFLPKSTASVA